MKTKDFLKRHSACKEGVKWALSISGDMVDVWNAMIEQGKHEWLIWTATRPGVFPDTALRKLVCRFIRETPLADGRMVWDLLIDERSRRAIEVAEFYADGKATKEELNAAAVAAAAAYAALDAFCDAGLDDAAYAAAYAAAALDDAGYAAARAVRVAATRDAAARAAAAPSAAYATAFAAYVAAHDAAYAAAKAAQVQMISELGNPFKKGADK